MPRRARLCLPGIPWHIIQRGNNRSVCFNAEEDYYFYIYHLAELAAPFGCAIHAYVLMTNHVHLLLTPEKANSVALLMPAQIGLVRLWVGQGLVPDPRILTGNELHVQFGHDLPGDLVLKCKQILQLAIEPLRPQVIACGCIDQLDIC